MVARTRYRHPLPEGPARKFAALSDQFELRVLATAADGRPRDDGRFRLVGRLPVADGPLFYLLLPLRVRRLARRHRPDAIVAQSPYEAACVRLAATGARLVVEVHGDWRTATRLYGSPSRRLLGPVADRVAAFGLRGADAVRTISGYTSGLVRALGVEPTEEFVTFVDSGVFTEPPRVPVPPAPRVVFVGVLERYKNVEGLAAAWRIVSERVPRAELHLVGSGTLTAVAERLLAEGARWDRRLEPAELVGALDRARALVLPSPSEGLGRVVVEAFMRGRAVVGARAGGIPDIVEDGVNGLLVEPDDSAALAAAIERIVTDLELAARLGAAAAESTSHWVSTPEEYARRMRALVEATQSRGTS
jgi:glycosyltransferase involved in cell wall biosynthesis